MQPDASHIRQIKVVSNTHWDREFRRSFEKTRRRLLTMMDVTLDILEQDPAYHSFTMDGHAIMIDDYLEMRPERREQVERLIHEGRLIVGPYYTLAEEFSIGSESLVRNLMYGRKTVEKYGGKTPEVAYTPSSWGQTGQLPQILADFGLKYMMFYRGISHHEADAEWIWEAPDGTDVLASRFAVYARYNWYYQVHRAVTRDRVFDKDYVWSEHDEVPFRIADGLAGEDLSFDLLRPEKTYDKSRLKQAILDMVEREGRHFTTEVFLAMHGHDVSVAHPKESQVIADAKELLGDQFDIEHTDLSGFWSEAEKHLDREALPVLTGERRAYLKEGMWTFLFPGTISARTYLKQKDFDTTARLVRYAEPMASLASVTGADYPVRYLDRGWRMLLSNHTHDANGGCAPDIVCQDMEYRYRKAGDIADIVTEDAMAHVAANLSSNDQDENALQLIVFNPLPVSRDAVALVDLEVPREHQAQAARLEANSDKDVARQAIDSEKSSSFVDSIWDVPTILESNRLKFYAKFNNLPALGYRAYRVQPEKQELREKETLIRSHNRMENEHVAVTVNANGSVDMTCLATGRTYKELNYLSDQGECGNAWQHQAPTYDRIYNSLSCAADIAVVESGPLVSAIEARYRFSVPADYADGTMRSDRLVDLPVRVTYRLRAGARRLEVDLSVDNTAADHWLRANFPTHLKTDVSTADSHFDVVDRPIAIPDSRGWVEQAFGTHPLRSFVALSDQNDGFALLPRGIFEYEVIDDETRTLQLTLLRACRIKLAVSEEKQTELPDPGVQCPGLQKFQYAIDLHAGDWKSANLSQAADETWTPIRAVMTGRGQGELPSEMSLITLDSATLQVTAVKQAEDAGGLIVRLFNPTDEKQDGSLRFARGVKSAKRCRMDERAIEPIRADGKSISLSVDPKKIVTLRVQM